MASTRGAKRLPRLVLFPKCPVDEMIFLIDSLRRNTNAARGPRGPNAARALCKERIHDYYP